MIEPVRITLRGLAVGEKPVAVVEIDLDAKNEYVERVLAAVFGNEALPAQESTETI